VARKNPKTYQGRHRREKAATVPRTCSHITFASGLKKKPYSKFLGTNLGRGFTRPHSGRTEGNKKNRSRGEFLEIASDVKLKTPNRKQKREDERETYITIWRVQSLSRIEYCFHGSSESMLQLRGVRT